MPPRTDLNLIQIYCKCRLQAPKMTPGPLFGTPWAPRTDPSVPKRVPREPQRPTKCPQGDPRGPKGAPRRPKGRPKETPKPPPRHPKKLPKTRPGPWGPYFLKTELSPAREPSPENPPASGPGPYVQDFVIFLFFEIYSPLPPFTPNTPTQSLLLSGFFCRYSLHSQYPHTVLI